MLIRTNTRILALSPGARRTGVAAIEAGATGVRFRRLHVIAGRPEAETGRKTFEARLARVLAEEKPEVIVLETLEAARATRENLAVAQAVEAAVRGQKTRIEHIPLMLARRHIVGTGKDSTRVSLHRALRSRFPQLASCTRIPMELRRHDSRLFGQTEQYWERAFAALALALAAAEGTEPAQSPPLPPPRFPHPAAWSEHVAGQRAPDRSFFSAALDLIYA